VIPGKTPQKKQTMIYYAISKTYPKKLGQAVDEIFRVAACPPLSLLQVEGAASDKLTPKN
jgi:hypothetical protein